MPKTLTLACVLPATPDTLFDMYFDPRKHASFTGAPAEIGDRPGTGFTAFDGVLRGQLLYIVPKRIIVQTWRSTNWPPQALDSILTLTFWSDRGGGRIELAQVNVPDEDFAGVCEGWNNHYWSPWRTWLELNS